MVTEKRIIATGNKPVLAWVTSHREDLICWAVSIILWSVHLILMNGYWFMTVFFLIPLVIQVLNLFVFHDNNFLTSLQYLSLFIIIGWIPLPLVLEPTWLISYPWGIVMIIGIILLMVLMVLKNIRVTKARVIRKYLLEEEEKKLSESVNK